MIDSGDTSWQWSYTHWRLIICHTYLVYLNNANSINVQFDLCQYCWLKMWQTCMSALMVSDVSASWCILTLQNFLKASTWIASAKNNQNRWHIYRICNTRNRCTALITTVVSCKMYAISKSSFQWNHEPCARIIADYVIVITGLTLTMPGGKATGKSRFETENPPPSAKNFLCQA